MWDDFIFAVELDKLIGRAREMGFSRDEICSDLEIRMMALDEEEEGDGEES